VEALVGLEPARPVDDDAVLGPPSGSGARWAWKSASEGNGEMEFTAAMANERVDYALSFPDMGMRSSGSCVSSPPAPEPA